MTNPHRAAWPRIVAIIPVGRLENAKTRLGASLDAEERLALAQRLLRRTLQATIASPDLAETLVVSPDPAALEIAAAAGARTLRQRSGRLNAALRSARDDAVASGADAVVIVPIDLPLISAAVLAPLLGDLAAGGQAGGPRVVVVSDRHGRGTNVLGLMPPDVIDPAFGTDSLASHVAAGQAAGAEVVELGGPLTLDLDTTDDLLLVERVEPELTVG
jgi:2-phospho-L-lactate guanylyltransferase